MQLFEASCYYQSTQPKEKWGSVNDPMHRARVVNGYYTRPRQGQALTHAIKGKSAQRKEKTEHSAS
jgi:hypothetical protein